MDAEQYRAIVSKKAFSRGLRIPGWWIRLHFNGEVTKSIKPRKKLWENCRAGTISGET